MHGMFLWLCFDSEQAALQMKVEAEHQRKAEASRVSRMITDKYLKETIKR